jgi:hypothetical protein
MFKKLAAIQNRAIEKSKHHLDQLQHVARDSAVDNDRN